MQARRSRQNQTSPSKPSPSIFDVFQQGRMATKEAKITIQVYVEAKVLYKREG